MTKILAVITFLWASVSMAGIAGEWTGWGEWTYEGQGTHCDSMKLNFVETNNKLTRTGGYFDCQVVGLDVNAAEWIKEGNNLLVDGKIVGSMTDKTIHLTEAYDEQVKVVSDITIDGGHFDYKEVWLDKDNSEIYVITGRLFKKQ